MESELYIKGIYKSKMILLDQKPDIKDGTPVYVDISTGKDRIEIREWSIADRDLRDLTPLKVRELLISCFTYAHLEEALRKKQLRYTFSDYELAENALIAEILLCFKELQEDFENPTKTSILRVLHLLSEKQLNRGASPAIINNHRQRLISVINML